ncbi:MAG: hypothetical protein GY772_05585 [bacterium]|nr:hypothetical protein [bacterium]
MNFVVFQQPSVLQTWWAPGEVRSKRGLANRFFFSGARRYVQLTYASGLKAKTDAFLKRFFRGTFPPGAPSTLQKARGALRPLKKKASK